jgi:L-malate glycosyltransferase
MRKIKNQKKIKILFIIDFLYALTGGTENQLENLINKLDQKKYDIYLIVLRDTKWIRKDILKLNCSIIIFNIVKLKNPKTCLDFYHMYLSIKKICPDIVMTFFPLSNIVGVIIARLAKVKIILSSRRDFGLWLGRRDLIFLKFANKFVSRILTNSLRVKNLTSREEKVSAEKVNTIYNGIEANKFNSDYIDTYAVKKKIGIPSDSKVVGIIAGLKPMKKHHTFIKAAKRVIDKRSDVAFVIVGDGNMRKSLEKLTDELNIRKYIHFVGSQDDVMPFLSIFNIGINCSENEGLSNAIMEYMVSGVPCIVSNAGGNPELIKNGINGYLFELKNDEELAKKIISLIDDKESQRRFLMKSKEIILEQFSIENMINNYDEFFENLYLKMN